MFKNFVLLSSISVFCLTITGCATSQLFGPADTCTKLKRERIYQATNNNMEASWLTRGQKEKFNEEFQRNNCGS